MVSVTEALSVISNHLSPMPVVSIPVDENLSNYVVACDVFSQNPVPAFDASIVDGYAVRGNSMMSQCTF